jgi:signal transduction histidine kinase
VLVAAVRALSADLRGILSAVGRDIAPLRDRPGEVGEIAASVGRHVTGAAEVVGDLARLGTCPVGELPRPADLCDLLRQAVQSERPRAQRHDINLVLMAGGQAAGYPDTPESAEDTLEVGTLTVLFQVLIDHAIEASPRGSTITLRLEETPTAYQITFDDAGPTLPASARGNVLSRDFDAVSQGRAPVLSLIAASTIASHLRLVLDLDESPHGGTRVRLLLPRQTT